MTGFENVEAVKGSDGVYRVRIDGSNLSLNTTYYLKEAAAPSGYKINDTVYHCIVGANGLVTYKVGNGGSASSTVPTCTNEKEQTSQQPVAGTITVTVKDDAGNVISDAVVKVDVTNEDNGTNTEVTVGASGTETLTNQEAGNYKAKLTVPVGYELVGGDAEQTGQLSPGGTLDYVYTLKKVSTPETGSLVIVVIDERTGARVPRARLSVRGPRNYSLSTVTNDVGEATAYGLQPGNYTVTITEVPDGYTVTTNREIVKQVAAQQTTNFEYKVNKFGGLSIVVIDEKTGARVPDAELVITGPGNFSKQGRSDSNGEVKFTDLEPGEYTVKITRVPEGYFVTTEREFKKTVATNASTYYEFKVDKPVASDTDNNTNNNTNTNTGSGTSINAGTNTDSNNQNATNAVHRENVAPRTNDTSYMLLAIIMLFVAGVGLCAISIYKMKNKDI